MKMKIKTLELIEGAKKAEGLTVIIDVFRAFSTVCYLYKSGAKKVLISKSLEDSYALKKNNSSIILAGERHGKKLDGFDIGNSPSEIINKNFKDKIIALTTSAGTQGIINAKNSDEIIACSFVNVNATINYIKKINPNMLSIVAMGNSGIERAEEDVFCAEYIKGILTNKINEEEYNRNFNNIKESLKKTKSVQRFFDKDKPWSPEEDFWLCLEKDKFDYILKVQTNNNNNNNIILNSI